MHHNDATQRLSSLPPFKKPLTKNKDPRPQPTYLRACTLPHTDDAVLVGVEHLAHLQCANQPTKRVV